MKIPAGMTEEQVLKIIHNVARKHSTRKFSYLTYKDLYQHASMFCISKIETFDFGRATEANSQDIEKALFNWFSRILNNQMKNFYRDNIDKVVEQKGGKVTTTVITHHSIDQNERYDDVIDCHKQRDVEKIDQLIVATATLTDAEFEIFDGMLSGDHISQDQRDQVIEKCQLANNNQISLKNQ